MKNMILKMFGARADSGKPTTEKEKTSSVNREKGEAPRRYSPEIEQIHREFEGSADKLLAEATGIIEEANKQPVGKVKRMLALGFTKAKQVAETMEAIKKAELSAEQVETIKMFKRKYPMYKFITDEQVKEICHKYNLVFGEVSLYKGFIPEKNLIEIENFKIKDEDKPEIIVKSRNGELVGYAKISDVVNSKHLLYQKSGVYVEYTNGKINLKGGESKWGEFSKAYAVKNSNVFQICAPIKDMDMSGMSIKDGYKVYKHIPDPIVLCPVQNGYLIVTAWGDEASDPIVVNEIHN